MLFILEDLLTESLLSRRESYVFGLPERESEDTGSLSLSLNVHPDNRNLS